MGVGKQGTGRRGGERKESVGEEGRRVREEREVEGVVSMLKSP